jgi:hypothetical protein
MNLPSTRPAKDTARVWSESNVTERNQALTGGSATIGSEGNDAEGAPRGIVVKCIDQFGARDRDRWDADRELPISTCGCLCSPQWQLFRSFSARQLARLQSVHLG